MCALIILKHVCVHARMCYIFGPLRVTEPKYTNTRTALIYRKTLMDICGPILRAFSAQLYVNKCKLSSVRCSKTALAKNVACSTVSATFGGWCIGWRMTFIYGRQSAYNCRPIWICTHCWLLVSSDIFDRAIYMQISRSTRICVHQPPPPLVHTASAAWCRN